MNKQLIIGNLGADAETKKVGDTDLATFRVATSEKWKGKDGQVQERTTWHSVEVWGKLASAVGPYLKKGTMVYVEGPTIEDQFEKDGQTHYRRKVKAHSIKLLGGKPSGGGAQDSGGDPLPF